MTVLLTGGCACENIRYECTEEPIVQLICHCRDCQRASGSAVAPLMFFAADKFRSRSQLFMKSSAAVDAYFREVSVASAAARFPCIGRRFHKFRSFKSAVLMIHPAFKRRPSRCSHVHSPGLLFIRAPRNSRVGR